MVITRFDADRKLNEDCNYQTENFPKTETSMLVGVFEPSQPPPSNKEKQTSHSQQLLPKHHAAHVRKTTTMTINAATISPFKVFFHTQCHHILNR